MARSNLTPCKMTRFPIGKWDYRYLPYHLIVRSWYLLKPSAPAWNRSNGSPGAVMPPGEHRYVLEFRPPLHYVGLGISVVTLLFCLWLDGPNRGVSGRYCQSRREAWANDYISGKTRRPTSLAESHSCRSYVAKVTGSNKASCHITADAR